MIRAVIDTNVLVSSMISSAGNEALLVMAINQGLVTPCFSPEVLEEYSDVLRRPRFGFTPDEVEALLSMFHRRGNLLNALPISRTSPDPGDDKFIACAIAGKADFLVSARNDTFRRANELRQKS